MKKIPKLGIKRHLLTAISYVIPVVCGGGFLIAIGMGLGGKSDLTLTASGYSFWDVLATIGAASLAMLPIIIATGISFSIADKPGIAPGIIIGLSANAINAGFMGGIIGGFLGGYVVLGIIKYFRVPAWAKGIMPTLIIPLLSSLIGVVFMVYIIGIPIAALTKLLTDTLKSLNTSSLILFGIVIGALSAVDYGGPISKTIFALVLTMQAQGVKEPITALQLVNTATPIGFGLAHYIAKLGHKNIYTKVELETLKSAVPMGVINIVEGVIPLVMNDFLRSITATAIGGACGGAVTMILGADSSVPFGGFLMLPTMHKPIAGIISLVINCIVTGVVLAVIKKPVKQEVTTTVAEEDIDLDEIQVF